MDFGWKGETAEGRKPCQKTKRMREGGSEQGADSDSSKKTTMLGKGTTDEPSCYGVSVADDDLLISD